MKCFIQRVHLIGFDGASFFEWIIRKFLPGDSELITGNIRINSKREEPSEKRCQVSLVYWEEEEIKELCSELRVGDCLLVFGSVRLLLESIKSYIISEEIKGIEILNSNSSVGLTEEDYATRVLRLIRERMENPVWPRQEERNHMTLGMGEALSMPVSTRTAMAGWR